MSPLCRSCDGHVSHDYARVLGGNDSDTVERCYQCSNKRVDKSVGEDE